MADLAGLPLAAAVAVLVAVALVTRVLVGADVAVLVVRDAERVAALLLDTVREAVRLPVAAGNWDVRTGGSTVAEIARRAAWPRSATAVDGSVSE